MRMQNVKGSRARRAKRALLGALVVAVLSYAGCAVVTNKLVLREERTAVRDPESGLLVGTAPRVLGPEDSSCAVLMVHGYLGAGQNFADLPERLAQQGWRVRVMLLPGHGTSPHDLEAVTPDELIDAVLEEARALRAHHQKVVLVGHSMGGTLSTLAAAEVPLDGLVLAAPYFGITRRWYYVLSPEQWVRIGSPLLRWVYKGHKFTQVNRPEGKKQVLSYTWVPVKSGLALTELAREVNQPGLLERIECPVLLIHSHGDVAASPRHAAAAFERFPSSDKRFVWFDRSNHHLFFDYDREQVMEEIAAFVDQCSAPEPMGPIRDAQDDQKEQAMSYVIRKATERPALDGDWDGPQWVNANTLEVALFHEKSSDHRPRVRARVLYDAEGVYVMFRVEDRYVLATRTQYQDPVCRDACVEFFVQPKPDKGYFNFETSCIGTILLSYVEDPTRTPEGFEKSKPVAEDLANQIELFHSIPGPVIEEIEEETTWTVAYFVPFTLFEAHVGALGDVAGQEWRANFYKCADESSHPHWASWAPIAEELNFHRPDKFAPVYFER